MVGARERRKCIRSRGRRRRRPSPANGWLLVCWMTLCHTLPKFVDSTGYQVTGAGRRASIGWEPPYRHSLSLAVRGLHLSMSMVMVMSSKMTFSKKTRDERKIATSSARQQRYSLQQRNRDHDNDTRERSTSTIIAQHAQVSDGTEKLVVPLIPKLRAHASPQ